VDDGITELRYLVKHRVVGGFGDIVRLDDAQFSADHDPNLSIQAVPNPANAYVSDLDHAVDRSNNVFNLFDQGGINRVHQPFSDASGRPDQDDENEHAHDQSHDRVGPPQPRGHCDGSDQDGQ
jgi:hypothetical protein